MPPLNVFPAEEAVAQHGVDGVVFLDARDSAAIAQSGTNQEVHITSRVGCLNLWPIPQLRPIHKALTKDAEIYLVCAAGGQAALAGKTLIDMGYTNVTNIGGISDWTKAGGPVDGA